MFQTDETPPNPEENHRPSGRTEEDINDDQGRVKKFFKAAKAAGSFRQRSGFDEPSLGGRIPVGKADIGGVELPSLRGRNFGGPGGGSTEYATKPKPQFGKSFYM